jgi:hypothetical protein
LTGWRRVEVTERRRKQEFAEAVRRIAEEDYPEAEKIRVVLDNLSTHTKAAFYEAFDPERARRLARRVEFVYTHAGARLVAEHGRDRDFRAGEAMPQAEAAGRGDAAAGGEGVGGGAQPAGGERALAFRNGGGAHQAEQSLPISEILTEDY